MCFVAAPDVFDQDEDEGVVVLLEPHPPAERHAAVSAAVSGCPGRAISWVPDAADGA